jgi:uncharacterized protein YbcI
MRARATIPSRHGHGPAGGAADRVSYTAADGRGFAGLDGQREDRVQGPHGDTKPAALAGGRLLAAISTKIVAILREHYGRGPMNAKTYVLDDIIVVVMRGAGFTPLEQTIMDDDGADRVVAMRHEFQRVMAKRYKQTIKELTGRNVIAFLSQAHVEPDITIEVFLMDGPLDGCAALELIDAE